MTALQGVVVPLLLLLGPFSAAASIQNGTKTVDHRLLQSTEPIESYVLGNNGEPEEVYPLPLCAGDCDDDEDCGPGLICHLRDPMEAIPGCLGGEDDESRTDYCVLDPALLSQSPSVSFQPSISPSEPPIVAPSNSPSVSQRPSITPTDHPTNSPTVSAAPTKTVAPSSPPSVSPPSASPSSSPSYHPSLRPSSAPSSAPSHSGPFQLKLYWHSRSCWQEDCRNEVHWCMQCEGYRCNEGDILWIEHCRIDQPPMQLFEWLPVPLALYPNPALYSQAQFGQVQSAQWDPETEGYLCLERVGDRTYKLQECNVQRYKQWFQGFSATQPFELLNPPENPPLGATIRQANYCLTMPHHPRAFEGIYHTNCPEARGDRTNRWIAVYGDATERVYGNDLDEFNPRRYYRIGERRSNPSCKDITPCGPCQGHCFSDEDCEGSLRCFERSRWNRWETPPGCFGDGVPGMDYCYAKPGT